MKEQLATVCHDLTSEKTQHAELQKSLDNTQKTLATLQSDCYGKESEISALQQDLKVGEVCRPLTAKSILYCTPLILHKD